MNLLFIGMTLSVIGKGMLGLGVIWVHITMAKERKIDSAVVRSFRTELIVSITGFAMIIAGYLIEVVAFGGFSSFILCEGMECAATVINAAGS